jgi:predicted NAD/FAD-binding protein
LKHVGVPTAKTEVTFGVSRDTGKFEWAGTSLSSIFAQRKNFFKPRMWRLIFDIVRFNQFALDLLTVKDESENDSTRADIKKGQSNADEESIGQYLDREGYSQTFKDDYLIPMAAAVWSTNPDKCSLDFPAITLVRFMWNHHLLNTISARAPWMTIPGGTKQYIDAVVADFPECVHLKSRVTSLIPGKDGVVFLSVNGRTEVFDHVVLATHGGQALEILGQAANKQEKEILDAFKTSRNVAILHSDLSLMPRRKVAWSAWNYITESPFPPSSKTTNISKVCLTYWMNLLQHIPELDFGPVLVTLNPLSPPDPRLVQGIWEYSHPMYNAATIRSQALLPMIQNTRGISYCGAWTKYGFHEDGFSSGLSAAVNHLGAELPFEFVDSTFSRGRTPTLTWKNHLVRFLIQVVQLLLVASSILADKLWQTLDRRIAARRKVA